MLGCSCRFRPCTAPHLPRAREIRLPANASARLRSDPRRVATAACARAVAAASLSRGRASLEASLAGLLVPPWPSHVSPFRLFVFKPHLWKVLCPRTEHERPRTTTRSLPSARLSVGQERGWTARSRRRQDEGERKPGHCALRFIASEWASVARLWQLRCSAWWTSEPEPPGRERWIVCTTVRPSSISITQHTPVPRGVI
mmetsp:Transcript_1127/g.7323  ORF Transcript_1127/g.7323 Transcript_1127/m.7323 type:complete len:200 (+) Transcript_1127:2008-2607(+)